MDITEDEVLLDFFEIHSESVPSNEPNLSPLDYEGTLEMWKFDKKYGFIRLTELKQDIFVRISELKFEPNNQKIKGKVIFQKGHSKRSKKEIAVNVRLKLDSSDEIGYKNVENDKQELMIKVKPLKLQLKTDTRWISQIYRAFAFIDTNKSHKSDR